MVKNIGFAICGSFCTHAQILNNIKTLKEKGYNIVPILSYSAREISTRFGKSDDFYNKLYEITGNEPISTLVDVEPIGPKNLIDVLVVAPCTGNTLSKLANGISDTPVTLAAKGHLRNEKPVIIAVSTNDGLGMNLKNIATLMNTKHFYFVPFGQDDPEKKSKSLIADYDLIESAMLSAYEKKQIQPMIIIKKKD